MNPNEEELKAGDFQPDELAKQFMESSKRLHEWNVHDDLQRLQNYKRLAERNAGNWNNKKICGFTFCPFPHYNEHKLLPCSNADVKEDKIMILVPTKTNSQKVNDKKDGPNTKRALEIGQKASKAQLTQSMNDEPVLIVRRDKFRKPPLKNATKIVKDAQTRYINRENSVPYKHGAPTEQVFKEYREANMYSRARLTKVNKKELVSAIVSVRPPNLGPTVDHIGSESNIFTSQMQESAGQPDARSAERKETREDINKPALYTSPSKSESYLHVCSLSPTQQPTLRSRLTAFKQPPQQVHVHLLNGHMAEGPRTTFELPLDEENKRLETRTKYLLQNKRQEADLTQSMRKILKDDVERHFTISDIKTRAKPIRAEQRKSFDMQPTVVQLRNDVPWPDEKNHLKRSIPQQRNAERHIAVKEEVRTSKTTQAANIDEINRCPEKYKTVLGKKEDPKYRITLDFDGPYHHANARRLLDSSTIDGLAQRKTTRITKKRLKEKDTGSCNLFLSGTSIEMAKKGAKNNKVHEKKNRISPNILGFKITNSTIHKNSTKTDGINDVISSHEPSREEFLLPLHETEITQTYEVTQILSPQFGPDDRPQSDNEVIIRGYLGFMDDPREDFDIVIDPETFEGLNHHKKEEIHKMSQDNGESNSEKRCFDDALKDVNKSCSLPVTRVPEEIQLHDLFEKTESLKTKLQSDPIMCEVSNHLSKNNALEAQRQITRAIKNKDSYKTGKMSDSSNVRQNTRSRAERETCPNPEEVATLLDRLNIEAEDCLAAKQSVLHNPNMTEKGEFYRRALKSSYLQKYEGASLEQLKFGMKGAGQAVESKESQHPNSPAGGDASRDISSTSHEVSCGTDTYLELSAGLNFNYNPTEGTSNNNQCENPFLDTKHQIQTLFTPDPQHVRQYTSDESSGKCAYACMKSVRFAEPTDEEYNHRGFGVKNSMATTNLSDKSEPSSNFVSRTELERYSVHSFPSNKKKTCVTAKMHNVGEINEKFSPSKSKSEPHTAVTVRVNKKKCDSKLDITPNKALAELIAANAMRSGMILSDKSSYTDQVYNTQVSNSPSIKLIPFDLSEKRMRRHEPTAADVPETSQTAGESHSLQYSELTTSYSDLLSKLKQVNLVNNQYKAKRRR